MGSSGCGKTTLISSLIGVIKLDKGEVKIFGESFKSKHFTKIGFMPQETALIETLTISEMMWFFGKIFSMTSEQVDERLKFLSQLLNLPNEKSTIKNCSGGQQRRISFGLAILHEPELLVLDEPTVGVDPLLRSMIWEYLHELVETKGVSVLLSTHYVDEARMSTKVGFMRNGVKLIEDSPHNIVEICETRSLNEAFLMLCQKQTLIHQTENEHFESITCSSDLPQNDRTIKQTSRNIMTALLFKQCKELRRNLG